MPPAVQSMLEAVYGQELIRAPGLTADKLCAHSNRVTQLLGKVEPIRSADALEFRWGRLAIMTDGGCTMLLPVCLLVVHAMPISIVTLRAGLCDLRYPIGARSACTWTRTMRPRACRPGPSSRSAASRTAGRWVPLC